MSDLPRRLFVICLCWTLTILLVAGSKADEPAHRPIVSGFERFFSEPSTDAESGGLLLLGELNCTNCHKATGEDAPLVPVVRKQAPILDRVGSRIKVDHLRAFLSDPHEVKPGTTMPNLIASLPKDLAADAVDALVHFLASTGTLIEKAPNRKLIAQGKGLFEQSGCAACHGAPGDRSSSLATSIPLGVVGGKFSNDSLIAFLQDPLTTRPSGRMPSMNLKPAEAQAIASYLLKDVHVDSPPTLVYDYYEGDWENLPDFAKLMPLVSGMAEGFDVELAGRHSNYALRFEGTLEVDRPGPYTFHLASDDGSRLWVDNRLVTDNDGTHPTSRKSGRLRLDRGRHQVVVGFFQGSGEEELDVEYEGPGLSRRPLAPALAIPEGKAAPVPVPKVVAARFVADPSKVEKGRALFASIGCASCHQLQEGGKAIEPRAASKRLGELRADAGCLAAEPPNGVPDYDLSPRQRTAIASALKSGQKPPTDRESIARTLVAFNCYSCHVRDGVGGVEDDRNPLFATTQKEMGDEGRIPPLLTGVGAKLTESWLKHVLADGAKDRPYMRTRMPKFGEANVEHLVKALGSVDSVEPVPTVSFEDPPKRVKATGRLIVGSQTFNCGSCHKFREFEAGGIQALDMTLMTKRLRRDWFQRYIVDPQAFRPGTRMPTAWPGGKSQLEMIYDGDTVKQIESVWVYLSDGPSAAVPYGLGRDPIPLIADKEPVIYRNFIEGAGPRAIGVGYPTKSNLAFDANDLRLALIWQGAFIDASKHWTGRGEGFQAPLGDNILNLPAGPAFATLADETAEWPRKKAKELGQKFRGYELAGDKRPAFLYDIGEVHARDLPFGIVVSGIPLIHRAIDLSTEKLEKGLYFRAAVGKTIEFRGDGTYQVDSEWKVRIATQLQPIIRNSAGKTELIVPINLDIGRARIVEEFTW